jgi:hypothetical protein
MKVKNPTLAQPARMGHTHTVNQIVNQTVKFTVKLNSESFWVPHSSLGS